MKKAIYLGIFVCVISFQQAFADEYEDAVSKAPILPTSSFPKMPESFGRYEKLALDLAFKQEVRAYFLCTGSSSCSDEVGILINRRNIGLSPGAFTAVVRNRFALCNDLDAFTEFKGTTDSCKRYMYDGFKQWITYSKDKNISRAAWDYGARKAGVASEPARSGDAWNFNAWNGYIRIAKNRGM